MNPGRSHGAPAGASHDMRLPDGRARLVRAAQVLGLAAIVLALCPAASGAAAPREFFGIAMGGPTDISDYKVIRKAGVRTMRISLPWSRVEPRRGQFAWPDGRVLSLAQHGIRPVISVYGSPSWATGSRDASKPPVNGRAKRTWKAFLRKAVRRYEPRGALWRKHPGISPRPVRSWQIWNEPNLPKYFHAKHPPRKYAKLVRASDKAIHGADRDANVVLAGLSGNPKTRNMAPQRFLKRMLRAPKVRRHFDAAALHPYAPTIKKFKHRVARVHRTLSGRGAASKKLWLTEVGWGSGPRRRSPLNKGLHGQARMLQKSFRMALHKRKAWHLKRVLWFDWRDFSAARAPCSFCPYTGLVRSDRSPKPAFRKFRHFTRRAHRHGSA